MLVGGTKQPFEKARSLIGPVIFQIIFTVDGQLQVFGQWIEAFAAQVAVGRLLFGLLHNPGKDGEGRTGALTQCGTAKADARIFGTHPGTGYDAGTKADEPAVGIVLRGAGLPSVIALQTVAAVEVPARSSLGRLAQELHHIAGGFFVEGLLAGSLGFCRIQHLPIGIFDAQHHHRFTGPAVVGKGGVGTHHLEETDAGAAQRQGGHVGETAFNAHLAGRGNHRGNACSFNELRRHRVHRVDQSPLQRVPAFVHAVRIGGRPVVVVDIGSGGIRQHFAGRIALLQRSGVHQGLKGRARLPPGLYMVVLIKAKVNPAHPGQYVAAGGIHSYKTGMQGTETVANGVDGRTLHPFLAFGGIDQQGLNLLHFFHNGCVLQSLFTEQAVAGTLADGLSQHFGLLRPGLFLAPVFVEASLQGRHVLAHGRYGKALEPGIQGRRNFQSVGLQAVLTVPAFLQKLDALLAYLLQKPGGGTVAVVDAAVVGLQGPVFIAFAILGRQKALMGHAVEHYIAASQGPFGVEAGTVGGIGGEHAYQGGGFGGIQLGRGLAEEAVGGHLNAVNVLPKRHGVEVKAQDVVLAEDLLETRRNKYLTRFVDGEGQPADASAGVEVLGQLLADGAAAPLPCIAQQDGLDKDAAQTDEVEAPVLKKATVLGGNEGILNVNTDLLIVGIQPVLDKVLPNHTAIGRIHHRGIMVPQSPQLHRTRNAPEETGVDQ